MGTPGQPGTQLFHDTPPSPPISDSLRYTGTTWEECQPFALARSRWTCFRTCDRRPCAPTYCLKWELPVNHIAGSGVVTSPVSVIQVTRNSRSPSDASLRSLGRCPTIALVGKDSSPNSSASRRSYSARGVVRLMSKGRN